MFVKTIGEGPRVVLVHGSLGYPNWAKQASLSDAFQLEIVVRPGYPPNPPERVIDFEETAKLVADQFKDGAHLVGHSYGGIICLLAAASRPEAIRSLTISEPPCFSIARGNVEVETFVTSIERLYDSGPSDPRDFMIAFLALTGSKPLLLNPLPPHMLRFAQALMVERLPWEAQIPLDDIRRAPYPKLVVSGELSHPALIEVCDVLERGLGSRRAILAMSDHRIMDSPDFNGILLDFLTEAQNDKT